MKLSTILHNWHYLTKTSRNCQWGSPRCTLHVNLQLTYEAFPSNPSKFTHVQSMHLAPHSLGAHAILPARATHSLAGEQPTDGPPGGQAVRSTAPHPKSRHVWLTLTGLLESNQPFAERHSLNDNANQVLHYLACASARERKESNLLINCQGLPSSLLSSSTKYYLFQIHKDPETNVCQSKTHSKDCIYHLQEIATIHPYPSPIQEASGHIDAIHYETIGFNILCVT